MDTGADLPRNPQGGTLSSHTERRNVNESVSANGAQGSSSGKKEEVLAAALDNSAADASSSIAPPPRGGGEVAEEDSDDDDVQPPPMTASEAAHAAQLSASLPTQAAMANAKRLADAQWALRLSDKRAGVGEDPTNSNKGSAQMVLGGASPFRTAAISFGRADMAKAAADEAAERIAAAKHRSTTTTQRGGGGADVEARITDEIATDAPDGGGGATSSTTPVGTDNSTEGSERVRRYLTAITAANARKRLVAEREALAARQRIEREGGGSLAGSEAFRLAIGGAAVREAEAVAAVAAAKSDGGNTEEEREKSKAATATSKTTISTSPKSPKRQGAAAAAMLPKRAGGGGGSGGPAFADFFVESSPYSNAPKNKETEKQKGAHIIGRSASSTNAKPPAPQTKGPNGNVNRQLGKGGEGKKTPAAGPNQHNHHRRSSLPTVAGTVHLDPKAVPPTFGMDAEDMVLQFLLLGYGGGGSVGKEAGPTSASASPAAAGVVGGSAGGGTFASSTAQIARREEVARERQRLMRTAFGKYYDFMRWERPIEDSTDGVAESVARGRRWARGRQQRLRDGGGGVASGGSSQQQSNSDNAAAFLHGGLVTPGSAPLSGAQTPLRSSSPNFAFDEDAIGSVVVGAADDDDAFLDGLLGGFGGGQQQRSPSSPTLDADNNYITSAFPAPRRRPPLTLQNQQHQQQHQQQQTQRRVRIGIGRSGVLTAVEEEVPVDAPQPPGTVAASVEVEGDGAVVSNNGHSYMSPEEAEAEAAARRACDAAVKDDDWVMRTHEPDGNRFLAHEEREAKKALAAATGGGGGGVGGFRVPLSESAQSNKDLIEVALRSYYNESGHRMGGGGGGASEGRGISGATKNVGSTAKGFYDEGDGAGDGSSDAAFVALLRAQQEHLAEGVGSGGGASSAKNALVGALSSLIDDKIKARGAAMRKEGGGDGEEEEGNTEEEAARLLAAMHQRTREQRARALRLATGGLGSSPTLQQGGARGTSKGRGGGGSDALGDDVFGAANDDEEASDLMALVIPESMRRQYDEERRRNNTSNFFEVDTEHQSRLFKYHHHHRAAGGGAGVPSSEMEYGASLARALRGPPKSDAAAAAADIERAAALGDEWVASQRRKMAAQLERQRAEERRRIAAAAPTNGVAPSAIANPYYNDAAPRFAGSGATTAGANATSTNDDNGSKGGDAAAAAANDATYPRVYAVAQPRREARENGPLHSPLHAVAAAIAPPPAQSPSSTEEGNANAGKKEKAAPTQLFDVGLSAVTEGGAVAITATTPSAEDEGDAPYPMPEGATLEDYGSNRPLALLASLFGLTEAELSPSHTNGRKGFISTAEVLRNRDARLAAEAARRAEAAAAEAAEVEAQRRIRARLREYAGIGDSAEEGEDEGRGGGGGRIEVAAAGGGSSSVYALPPRDLLSATTDQQQQHQYGSSSRKTKQQSAFRPAFTGATNMTRTATSRLPSSATADDDSQLPTAALISAVFSRQYARDLANLFNKLATNDLLHVTVAEDSYFSSHEHPQIAATVEPLSPANGRRLRAYYDGPTAAQPTTASAAASTPPTASGDNTAAAGGATLLADRLFKIARPSIYKASKAKEGQQLQPPQQKRGGGGIVDPMGTDSSSRHGGAEAASQSSSSLLPIPDVVVAAPTLFTARRFAIQKDLLENYILKGKFDLRYVAALECEVSDSVAEIQRLRRLLHRREGQVAEERKIRRSYEQQLLRVMEGQRRAKVKAAVHALEVEAALGLLTTNTDSSAAGTVAAAAAAAADALPTNTNHSFSADAPQPALGDLVASLSMLQALKTSHRRTIARAARRNALHWDGSGATVYVSSGNGGEKGGGATSSGGPTPASSYPSSPANARSAKGSIAGSAFASIGSRRRFRSSASPQSPLSISATPSPAVSMSNNNAALPISVAGGNNSVTTDLAFGSRQRSIITPSHGSLAAMPSANNGNTNALTSFATVVSSATHNAALAAMASANSARQQQTGQLLAALANSRRLQHRLLEACGVELDEDESIDCYSSDDDDEDEEEEEEEGAEDSDGCEDEEEDEEAEENNEKVSATKDEPAGDAEVTEAGADTSTPLGAAGTALETPIGDGASTKRGSTCSKTINRGGSRTKSSASAAHGHPTARSAAAPPAMVRRLNAYLERRRYRWALQEHCRVREAMLMENEDSAASLFQMTATVGAAGLPPTLSVSAASNASAAMNTTSPSRRRASSTSTINNEPLSSASFSSPSALGINGSPTSVSPSSFSFSAASAGILKKKGVADSVTSGEAKKPVTVATFSGGGSNANGTRRKTTTFTGLDDSALTDVDNKEGATGGNGLTAEQRRRAQRVAQQQRDRYTRLTNATAAAVATMPNTAVGGYGGFFQLGDNVYVRLQELFQCLTPEQRAAVAHRRQFVPTAADGGGGGAISSPAAAAHSYPNNSRRRSSSLPVFATRRDELVPLSVLQLRQQQMLQPNATGAASGSKVGFPNSSALPAASTASPLLNSNASFSSASQALQGKPPHAQKRGGGGGTAQQRQSMQPMNNNSFSSQQGLGLGLGQRRSQSQQNVPPLSQSQQQNQRRLSVLSTNSASLPFGTTSPNPVDEQPPFSAYGFNGSHAAPYFVRYAEPPNAFRILERLTSKRGAEEAALAEEAASGICAPLSLMTPPPDEGNGTAHSPPAAVGIRSPLPSSSPSAALTVATTTAPALYTSNVYNDPITLFGDGADCVCPLCRFEFDASKPISFYSKLVAAQSDRVSQQRAKLQLLQRLKDEGELLATQIAELGASVVGGGVNSADTSPRSLEQAAKALARRQRRLKKKAKAAADGGEVADDSPRGEGGVSSSSGSDSGAKGEASPSSNTADGGKTNNGVGGSPDKAAATSRRHSTTAAAAADGSDADDPHSLSALMLMGSDSRRFISQTAVFAGEIDAERSSAEVHTIAEARGMIDLLQELLEESKIEAEAAQSSLAASAASAAGVGEELRAVVAKYELLKLQWDGHTQGFKDTIAANEVAISDLREELAAKSLESRQWREAFEDVKYELLTAKSDVEAARACRAEVENVRLEGGFDRWIVQTGAASVYASATAALGPAKSPTIRNATIYPPNAFSGKGNSHQNQQQHPRRGTITDSAAEEAEAAAVRRHPVTYTNHHGQRVTSTKIGNNEIEWLNYRSAPPPTEYDEDALEGPTAADAAANQHDVCSDADRESDADDGAGNPMVAGASNSNSKSPTKQRGKKGGGGKSPQKRGAVDKKKDQQQQQQPSAGQSLAHLRGGSTVFSQTKTAGADGFSSSAQQHASKQRQKFPPPPLHPPTFADSSDTPIPAITHYRDVAYVFCRKYYEISAQLEKIAAAYPELFTSDPNARGAALQSAFEEARQRAMVRETAATTQIFAAISQFHHATRKGRLMHPLLASLAEDLGLSSADLETIHAGIAAGVAGGGGAYVPSSSSSSAAMMQQKKRYSTAFISEAYYQSALSPGTAVDSDDEETNDLNGGGGGKRRAYPLTIPSADPAYEPTSLIGTMRPMVRLFAKPRTYVDKGVGDDPLPYNPFFYTYAEEEKATSTTSPSTAAVGTSSISASAADANATSQWRRTPAKKTKVFMKSPHEGTQTDAGPHGMKIITYGARKVPTSNKTKAKGGSVSPSLAHLVFGASRSRSPSPATIALSAAGDDKESLQSPDGLVDDMAGSNNTPTSPSAVSPSAAAGTPLVAANPYAHCNPNLLKTNVHFIAGDAVASGGAGGGASPDDSAARKSPSLHPLPSPQQKGMLLPHESTTNMSAFFSMAELGGTQTPIVLREEAAANTAACDPYRSSDEEDFIVLAAGRRRRLNRERLQRTARRIGSFVIGNKKKNKKKTSAAEGEAEDADGGGSSVGAAGDVVSRIAAGRQRSSSFGHSIASSTASAGGDNAAPPASITAAGSDNEGEGETPSHRPIRSIVFLADLEALRAVRAKRRAKALARLPPAPIGADVGRTMKGVQTFVTSTRTLVPLASSSLLLPLPESEGNSLAPLSLQQVAQQPASSSLGDVGMAGADEDESAASTAAKEAAFLADHALALEAAASNGAIDNTGGSFNPYTDGALPEIALRPEDGVACQVLYEWSTTLQLLQARSASATEGRERSAAGEEISGEAEFDSEEDGIAAIEEEVADVEEESAKEKKSISRGDAEEGDGPASSAGAPPISAVEAGAKQAVTIGTMTDPIAFAPAAASPTEIPTNAVAEVPQQLSSLANDASKSKTKRAHVSPSAAAQATATANALTSSSGPGVGAGEHTNKGGAAPHKRSGGGVTPSAISTILKKSSTPQHATSPSLTPLSSTAKYTPSSVPSALLVAMARRFQRIVDDAKARAEARRAKGQQRDEAEAAAARRQQTRALHGGASPAAASAALAPPAASTSMVSPATAPLSPQDHAEGEGQEGSTNGGGFASHFAFSTALVSDVAAAFAAQSTMPAKLSHVSAAHSSSPAAAALGAGHDVNTSASSSQHASTPTPPAGPLPPRIAALHRLLGPTEAAEARAREAIAAEAALSLSVPMWVWAPMLLEVSSALGQQQQQQQRGDAAKRGGGGAGTINLRSDRSSPAPAILLPTAARIASKTHHHPSDGKKDNHRRRRRCSSEADYSSSDLSSSSSFDSDDSSSSYASSSDLSSIVPNGDGTSKALRRARRRARDRERARRRRQRKRAEKKERLVTTHDTSAAGGSGCEAVGGSVLSSSTTGATAAGTTKGAAKPSPSSFGLAAALMARDNAHTEATRRRIEERAQRRAGREQRREGLAAKRLDATAREQEEWERDAVARLEREMRYAKEQSGGGAILSAATGRLATAPADAAASPMPATARPNAAATAVQSSSGSPHHSAPIRLPPLATATVLAAGAAGSKDTSAPAKSIAASRGKGGGALGRKGDPPRRLWGTSAALSAAAAARPKQTAKAHATTASAADNSYDNANNNDAVDDEPINNSLNISSAAENTFDSQQQPRRASMQTQAIGLLRLRGVGGTSPAPAATATLTPPSGTTPTGAGASLQQPSGNSPTHATSSYAAHIVGSRSPTNQNQNEGYVQQQQQKKSTSAAAVGVIYETRFEDAFLIETEETKQQKEEEEADAPRDFRPPTGHQMPMAKPPLSPLSQLIRRSEKAKLIAAMQSGGGGTVASPINTVEATAVGGHGDTTAEAAMGGGSVSLPPIGGHLPNRHRDSRGALRTPSGADSLAASASLPHPSSVLQTARGAPPPLPSVITARGGGSGASSLSTPLAGGGAAAPAVNRSLDANDPSLRRRIGGGEGGAEESTASMVAGLYNNASSLPSPPRTASRPATEHMARGTPLMHNNSGGGAGKFDAASFAAYSGGADPLPSLLPPRRGGNSRGGGGGIGTPIAPLSPHGLAESTPAWTPDGSPAAIDAARATSSRAHSRRARERLGLSTSERAQRGRMATDSTIDVAEETRHSAPFAPLLTASVGAVETAMPEAATDSVQHEKGMASERPPRPANQPPPSAVLLTTSVTRAMAVPPSSAPSDPPPSQTAAVGVALTRPVVASPPATEPVTSVPESAASGQTTSTVAAAPPQLAADKAAPQKQSQEETREVAKGAALSWVLAGDLPFSSAAGGSPYQHKKQRVVPPKSKASPVNTKRFGSPAPPLSEEPAIDSTSKATLRIDGATPPAGPCVEQGPSFSMEDGPSNNENNGVGYLSGGDAVPPMPKRTVFDLVSDAQHTQRPTAVSAALSIGGAAASSAVASSVAKSTKPPLSSVSATSQRASQQTTKTSVAAASTTTLTTSTQQRLVTRGLVSKSVAIVGRTAKLGIVGRGASHALRRHSGGEDGNDDNADDGDSYDAASSSDADDEGEETNEDGGVASKQRRRCRSTAVEASEGILNAMEGAAAKKRTAEERRRAAAERARHQRRRTTAMSRTLEQKRRELVEEQAFADRLQREEAEARRQQRAAIKRAQRESLLQDSDGAADGIASTASSSDSSSSVSRKGDAAAALLSSGGGGGRDSPTEGGAAVPTAVMLDAALVPIEVRSVLKSSGGDATTLAGSTAAAKRVRIATDVANTYSHHGGGTVAAPTDVVRPSTTQGSATGHLFGFVPTDTAEGRQQRDAILSIAVSRSSPPLAGGGGGTKAARRSGCSVEGGASSSSSEDDFDFDDEAELEGAAEGMQAVEDGYSTRLLQAARAKRRAEAAKAKESAKAAASEGTSSQQRQQQQQQVTGATLLKAHVRTQRGAAMDKYGDDYFEHEDNSAAGTNNNNDNDVHPETKALLSAAAAQPTIAALLSAQQQQRNNNTVSRHLQPSKNSNTTAAAAAAAVAMASQLARPQNRVGQGKPGFFNTFEQNISSGLQTSSSPTGAAASAAVSNTYRDLALPPSDGGGVAPLTVSPAASSSRLPHGFSPQHQHQRSVGTGAGKIAALLQQRMSLGGGNNNSAGSGLSLGLGPLAKPRSVREVLSSGGGNAHALSSSPSAAAAAAAEVSARTATRVDGGGGSPLAALHRPSPALAASLSPRGGNTQIPTGVAGGGGRGTNGAVAGEPSASSPSAPPPPEQPLSLAQYMAMAGGGSGGTTSNSQHQTNYRNALPLRPNAITRKQSPLSSPRGGARGGGGGAPTSSSMQPQSITAQSPITAPKAPQPVSAAHTAITVSGGEEPLVELPAIFTQPPPPSSHNGAAATRPPQPSAQSRLDNRPAGGVNRSGAVWAHRSRQ